MSKKTGNLTLILVAIIWGTSFAYSQIAIDYGFTPIYIILLRFAFAIFFFLFVIRKEIFSINKSYLKNGIIGGSLLFLAYLFQLIGLKYTTPANNAFLTVSGVTLVPFVN
ncbi:MAG: EamA family transporter, partial [Oscillospiraceae bacterium]